MKIKYDLTISQNPSNIKCDCMVVPVFSHKNKDNQALAQLHDAAKQLDTNTQQMISKFIKTGDFSGKLEQTHIFYQLPGINAARVLLIGCGKQDKFDIQALNTATKAACKAIKDAKINHLCFYLADGFDNKAQAAMQIIIAQADAFYTLDDYKSSDKSKQSLKHVSIALTDKIDKSGSAAMQTAIKQGAAIAQGMKLSRDLGNQPGNVCTPTYIAKQAKALAKDYSNLSFKVLEEADMEKLGMGSFLSVSKGSDEPGKMIILQYKGADKSAAPVALVGKGVTFDTGGISIKPAEKMDEMKYDMSGAAAVLGLFEALGHLKPKVNVVGLIPASENLPSGSAIKPGDVVRSQLGKTIEIANTDAEGRLVLCDALADASDERPDLLIDYATLTGAARSAVGTGIAAFFGNDEALADELLAAARQKHDPVWRLPLHKPYETMLKSRFADLVNCASSPYAGAIVAALFLQRFVDDGIAWLHFDMMAWNTSGTPGHPEGGEAMGVRAMFEELRRRYGGGG